MSNFKLLLTTLNINGLNTLTKRQIRKMNFKRYDSPMCCHLTYDKGKSKGMERDMTHEPKKARGSMVTSDKLDSSRENYER